MEFPCSFVPAFCIVWSRGRIINIGEVVVGRQRCWIHCILQQNKKLTVGYIYQFQWLRLGIEGHLLCMDISHCSEVDDANFGGKLLLASGIILGREGGKGDDFIVHMASVYERMALFRCRIVVKVTERAIYVGFVAIMDCDGSIICVVTDDCHMRRGFNHFIGTFHTHTIVGSPKIHQNAGTA